MDFVKFGVETDIGGNNPKNQDYWFQWKNNEKRQCLFGIADGHGTYGEVVARLSSKTILEYIETVDLETDTLAILHRCFTLCNEKFGDICPHWSDTTTLGGTTLTVVAIVNNKIYVANVGDSPVYLCTESPVLKRSMIRYEMDCAVDPALHLLSEDEHDDDDKLCSTIELTRSHAADNVREFDRIRKQHPSSEKPGYPRLNFLYDNHGLRKNLGDSIFTVEDESLVPVKNGVGKFYKNVSKEWGTVVTGLLPGYLAFTRSIGDFYWKGYGVTEHPEIQSFDLDQIGEGNDVICIVAVSDGVSDNWLTDHVGKFVMDPSCLKAVLTQPDVGAQRVAMSFIRRTLQYGSQNFGNNTDNATANIAYIRLRGVFAEDCVQKKKE